MWSFRRSGGSGTQRASSDVAGMAGLEPTISESKSGVLPLHYIPRFWEKRPAPPAFSLSWGGIWGSNPRHPEPQSGALPTELIPPDQFLRREGGQTAAPNLLPPSGVGTPRGIRTPDLLLRRQLLYPAELLAHMRCTRLYGAGDGNRTHVSSLEGWCSTIELHPHGRFLIQPRDNTIVFPGLSISFFGNLEKSRGGSSPPLYPVILSGASRRAGSVRRSWLCQPESKDLKTLLPCF